MGLDAAPSGLFTFAVAWQSVPRAVPRRLFIACAIACSVVYTALYSQAAAVSTTAQS